MIYFNNENLTNEIISLMKSLAIHLTKTTSIQKIASFVSIANTWNSSFSMKITNIPEIMNHFFNQNKIQEKMIDLIFELENHFHQIFLNNNDLLILSLFTSENKSKELFLKYLNNFQSIDEIFRVRTVLKPLFWRTN